MAEVMTGKRWHTREDSGLVLDRRLRWWHDGEPFENAKLIELFNISLAIADDGRFVVRIGADWAYVAVEDAAYEVRTVDVSEGDRLSVRLSDRTADLLDVASLEVDDEGVLTCRVKGGRAKARFSRDAQVQLGAHLEPEGEGVVLVVGARREPLPAGLSAALGA